MPACASIAALWRHSATSCARATRRARGSAPKVPRRCGCRSPRAPRERACTWHSRPRTAPPSIASTRAGSRPEGATTALPDRVPTTAPNTTPRSSSTQTATTSRPCATASVGARACRAGQGRQPGIAARHSTSTTQGRTKMASIRKEAVIDASPEEVWEAVRDVGAVHTRLAPGFVTDTRLEEGARVVTFANGLVARELIVDVDDAGRRLVWAVVGSPRLTHHNASVQVLAEDERRSRVVWIADLLPHEMAAAIAGMMEQGLGAMKKAL